MRFIYSFSVRLYSLFIALAFPFSSKARLWIIGRKGQWEKLKKSVTPSDKIIWVHCASLGEFEQGRPVMESLRVKYPGYKILLTFYSPSGFEVRKNYPGADYIMYLPSDTPRNARKFLSVVNPRIAIFIKYEFWYNYLIELRSRKIPLFLVSGIFRPGQYFFRWYGSWFREQLKSFTHFFVQDEVSMQLLNGIGLNNVTVSGDTRFDRVCELVKSKAEDVKVRQFCGDSVVVIAGSTWPEDEELLVKYINQHAGNAMKWIIAPHVISEAGISRFISKVKLKCVRYSKAGSMNEARVLMVDTIGILGIIYRYGHIAHIGGGFGKGIHNILEPAAYGLPVIFGPRYEKFREAKELIGLKGAFAVGNYDEYESILNRLSGEVVERKKASAICANYTNENKGALEKILEALTKYIIT